MDSDVALLGLALLGALLTYLVHGLFIALKGWGHHHAAAGDHLLSIIRWADDQKDAG